MGFIAHLTTPWFNFEPSEADNSVTLQKSFKKVTMDDYCRHTEGLFTDCLFFSPNNHYSLAWWLLL